VRVFVTGVAGFLGSHIAEHFVQAGCAVAGIDNMLGGAKENVPDGVEFVVADCANREAYAGLVDGADLVYHCAAAPWDALSVFSPHLVYQHTAGSTAAVVSVAAAASVGRFILCSSMTRYGAAPAPFTEDLPPAPVNPYGLAKHASELLVRNVAETHGMEWVIAVPHNIIGPRQKFDDPYRNAAAIMINRMLRGQPPIIYGDGLQRRCFSYIADVVEPFARLGTEAHLAGEVVNVGPDRDYVTIRELAELIAELIGVPCDPVHVPARPCEVREAACSSDKARRLLGYRPQWTLRDGLAEMVAWIRAAGPREFSYHLPIEIVNERTPATWTLQLI